MHTIYSQTDDKIINTSSDETILNSSLKSNIDHTCVCGGNARCSTCRVKVLKGIENCLPRNEKEMRIAYKLGLPDDIRLACQTKIKGDITTRRLVMDDMDTNIILKQLDGAPGAKMGQEKNLAILFIDIENYTQFAEAFPAYDVVHVLNRYYRMVNQIVIKYKGLISDVAGDGVLCLFGVTQERDNTVMDAINSVRAMSAALDEFNEYLFRVYNQFFRIRAGINHGKVIVGNFNTGMMNKVAAIGDEVNLTSRIENANKKLNTRLLLSQSAKDLVDASIPTTQMAPLQLKGKSGEYVLYQVSI